MNTAVPQVFSERRRRLRLERALASQRRPGAARWLIEAMADDVIERLGFLRWDGERALISGLAGDRVAGAVGFPSPDAPVDFARPIAGAPYDLIVSLGELDTVNDLPGALIHLRHALAPGGLLLAAMTGAGSLPRLRQAMLAADGDRPAARIHPQIDARAASALLQRAGFTRQVVDDHALIARYSSIDRLIGDLRQQGQGSVLADQALALGRAAWLRAASAFADCSEADGKTSEHFEIVTVTAWKD